MSHGNETMKKCRGNIFVLDPINEVREYLRDREPIFHHREITNTREDADWEMHQDFWEIGASGRLYTRGFVLNYLEERYRREHVDEMVAENWQLRDFNVQRLAEDIYLATYILEGQDRLTRRTTIWKGNLAEGLKILFHQGTIIQESYKIETVAEG